MDTRHTPGPWEVKHYHGATTKTFGGPHIQAGKRIVAWPEFPGVDENDASEANARLIAAAPDLLAVAVDMLAHWGMEIRTDADRAREKAILDDARAAIEKANAGGDAHGNR